jgi:hypothetical protein
MGPDAVTDVMKTGSGIQMLMGGGDVQTYQQHGDRTSPFQELKLHHVTWWLQVPLITTIGLFPQLHFARAFLSTLSDRTFICYVNLL